MRAFEQSAISAVKDLREKYFESIKLSQELFVERLAAGGTCFTIKENGERAGYFIKSKDNIIIEFFIEDAFVSLKEAAFKDIIERFSISKAYCKSFDFLLLACCHTYAKGGKIAGTLFRGYAQTPLLHNAGEFCVRIAAEKDISFLQTFKSGLYETVQELNFTVKNEMLHMFEKENEFIGCGYLIKILPDKNYYDTGMWTNPAYRRRGYASKIISYLKKYCIDNGYIPVCGCAAGNEASRKTLERNGFYGKYCLIEFDF
jgi:GNAT superfamily N-acetyltransferase